MYFVAQLINGLGIGSIYALIALGYSMVYGIIKLINFAHGDIIMVGGYSLMIFLTKSGVPVFLAMFLSIVICVLAGLLVQKIAYKRLLDKGAPKITLLITAIGISMFLQSVSEVAFGPESHMVPNMISFSNIKIGELTIPIRTLFNIAVSSLMMIILRYLVNKTRMGKAMRATSEDPDAAKLMGINTNNTIAFTFVIGSFLAGVAAVLYTNTYPNVKPTMGSLIGLKAFIAAVLGGIGSIPGAMYGGFLLGIAESLIIAYLPSTLSDAIVFSILIIVLLIKPTGLLGKNIKEKV